MTTPEPPYTVVRSSAELSVDDPRIEWPVTRERKHNGWPVDEGGGRVTKERVKSCCWDREVYDLRLRAPVAPVAPVASNATYPEADCLRRRGKRCHHEACATAGPNAYSESHDLARCKTCDGLIGPGHCTPVDGGCLFASRPRRAPVAPPEVACKCACPSLVGGRCTAYVPPTHVMFCNACRESDCLYGHGLNTLLAPSPGDAVVRDALAARIWSHASGSEVTRGAAENIADAVLELFDVSMKR